MVDRRALNAVGEEFDPFAEDVPARTMEDVARQSYRPREMAPATPRNAAIIPAGDAVRMGRFTLTPVGLTANGMVSAHEWEQFYISLKRVTESIQWATADWLLMGEHQHGKTYTQMSALTGLKEKTLREYAYVARSVHLSIRMDKLSFAHHQLVAALTPEEQRERLQYAADNKLSVGRFRAYLEGREVEHLSRVGRSEMHALKLYQTARKFKPADRQYVAGLLRQMADALESENPPEVDL